MSNTALVIGATGVVGSELVKQLCADERYTAVTCLVRTELGFEHAKLTQYKVDFAKAETWQGKVYADHVYCALGTTIKQAGSKTRQKQVDLQWPLAIAKRAKKHGTKGFALVSSSGAKASSSRFYFAIKGQLEQGIVDLDFAAVTIVQPSVLIGTRKEFRLGEEIAIKLLAVLQYLPWFNKYKAITGKQVAKALIQFHSDNQQGLTTKRLNQLFV